MPINRRSPYLLLAASFLSAPHAYGTISGSGHFGVGIGQLPPDHPGRVEVRDVIIGPPFPLDFEVTSGAMYARSAIGLSTVAGQTVLSVEVDLQRSGTIFAFASTGFEEEIEGEIQPVDDSFFFTAPSNEPYALEGAFGLTSTIAQFGSLVQDVYLFDMTTSTTLFSSFQSGGSGPFALTGPVLSGALTAGHSYLLGMRHAISLTTAGDSGAAAAGHLSLTIGSLMGDGDFD